MTCNIERQNPATGYLRSALRDGQRWQETIWCRRWQETAAPRNIQSRIRRIPGRRIPGGVYNFLNRKEAGKLYVVRLKQTQGSLQYDVQAPARSVGSGNGFYKTGGSWAGLFMSMTMARTQLVPRVVQKRS